MSTCAGYASSSAEHGILSDIASIPIDRIRTARRRMPKGARRRVVIDVASLPKAA